MNQKDGKRNVCRNCRHWQSNVQLIAATQKTMCTRGMGQTGPDDSCNMFLANADEKNQDLKIYF